MSAAGKCEFIWELKISSCMFCSLKAINRNEIIFSFNPYSPEYPCSAMFKCIKMNTHLISLVW